MKSIEQEIIRWFEAEDGIWVVDSAKTVEGILLKKAVQRIEELKEDLEDAQALADDWQRGRGDRTPNHARYLFQVVFVLALGAPLLLPSLLD